MTDFAPYKGQQVQTFSVKFGCDPEFFFAAAKDGGIVGSERVLTTQLTSSKYNNNSRHPCGETTKAFVQDGVQVELNPTPNTCRANLGNEIASAFRALREHLKKMDGVTASFKQVVEVSPEELASLSEKARALGCAPSHNAYDKKATVTCDGSVYRKRSAGGHIHLGLNDPFSHTPGGVFKARERLVPILDIMVGNTAVLIDRDPANAERRQVYGRAGEYRLPAHGLEYRTLSNFWLRDYKLMSGVLGLARMATSVLHTQEMWAPTRHTYYFPAEEELLSLVDLEKVRQAINTNDLALAWENFQAIRPFIISHFNTYTSLSLTYMKAFEFFLDGIDRHGIEHWFPDNPIDTWANMSEGHDRGWEAFMGQLTNKVPLTFSYAGPQLAPAPTVQEPEVRPETIRIDEVRNEVGRNAAEIVGEGAIVGDRDAVAQEAAAVEVQAAVQDLAAVARRAAASARAANRQRDRSGRFAPGYHNV